MSCLYQYGGYTQGFISQRVRDVGRLAVVSLCHIQPARRIPRSNLLKQFTLEFGSICLVYRKQWFKRPFPHLFPYVFDTRSGGTFSKPSSFRLMTSRSKSVLRPLVLLKRTRPVRPSQCACGHKLMASETGIQSKQVSIPESKQNPFFFSLLFTGLIRNSVCLWPSRLPLQQNEDVIKKKNSAETRGRFDR